MIKSNKQAFTLIELLVVVLIIGILAAVAVPQYQKAVEKSRATQALSMLDAAYKHAVMYYIANGAYPNTFDEMGMDVPWPTTSSDSLKWANMRGVTDTRSDGTWSFQLYHADVGSFVIYMGIVTGKYAGAGFQVPVVDSKEQLFPKNIQCVERKDHGIIFEQSPGYYCEKIINGTLSSSTTASTYRVYDLS